MKQVLIQIDDRCARDLERVAPTKHRARAEFIRRALRHAIDLELDRTTDAAYRAQPFPSEPNEADLAGWDEDNELRKPRAKRSRGRRRR